MVTPRYFLPADMRACTLFARTGIKPVRLQLAPASTRGPLGDRRPCDSRQQLVSTQIQDLQPRGPMDESGWVLVDLYLGRFWHPPRRATTGEIYWRLKTLGSRRPMADRFGPRSSWLLACGLLACDPWLEAVSSSATPARKPGDRHGRAMVPRPSPIARQDLDSRSQKELRTKARSLARMPALPRVQARDADLRSGIPARPGPSSHARVASSRKLQAKIPGARDPVRARASPTASSPRSSGSPELAGMRCAQRRSGGRTCGLGPPLQPAA